MRHDVLRSLSRPSTNARRFGSTIVNVCSTNVSLRPPMFGVMMTFGMRQSGLSGGSGCLEKTSSAGAGDLAGLKQFDQRRLVEHAAAREVDQEGAWASSRPAPRG